MSIQIFLQGKLLGIREFLSAGHPALDQQGSERLFAGKSWWVSLLSEILPRALLAEFGFSKMLLGASGGGQFLLVLPQESEPQANDFLNAAAAEIERRSEGRLKLIWATTENLGDWTIVRRRLREALANRRGTMARPSDPAWFTPTEPPAALEPDPYFIDILGSGLVETKEISWSPEEPGTVRLGPGKHTWTIGPETDQILLTRHVALSEDGKHPVSTAELGRRAEGTDVWGVLRGDVDSLDIRLRRLQSIEEHVQLSMLYKQFFAGELEVLCSMPEFWRKVTIVYSGGDDFAAYGSWDALIQMARELQRLFRRFSEESLKDFPGGEGKTMTMALALATGNGADLPAVYAEAGRMLESAKCGARDSFALLGRVLEWRQVGGASDLKDTMVRIAREFGGSTQFLRELASFYREEVFSPVSTPRRKEGELEKPWRLHRRVLRVLPATRDRELEKLRNSLIIDLVGKNASQVKLRPAGRVALEWARLVTQG
jgi:CRISPR-associated protein Csm1